MKAPENRMYTASVTYRKGHSVNGFENVSKFICNLTVDGAVCTTWVVHNKLHSFRHTVFIVYLPTTEN
jgi:hypothetical protein